MSQTIVELKNIIDAGESSTVELKQSITDSLVLARLIAAFANADGGQIIIGIRESSTIVGVNTNLVTQIYQHALTQLQPTPHTEVEFFSVDGKDIGVVTVIKSHTLVLSKDGAFIRVGAVVRAMSPQEIARALATRVLTVPKGGTDRTPATLPTITGTGKAALPALTGGGTAPADPALDIPEALSNLTNMVQELMKQLQEANSFRAKAENYIVGGIIGAILGWIFSIAVAKVLGM